MNNRTNRSLVIMGAFILIGFIFVIRLLYIQVVDDTWKNRAEDIALGKKSVKPPRGLIYDRNGEVLVASAPVYNLLVTPNKIKNLDTLKFCSLLEITKEDFLAKIEKASTGYNKPFLQSEFEKNISEEDFSKIAPMMMQFTGFEFEINSERFYPPSIAAHVLGYIREVDRDILDRDTTNYYKARDKIGIKGVELFYENELRGERGIYKYLKDNKGKAKKRLDGTYAVEGKTLFLTLDKDLQA